MTAMAEEITSWQLHPGVGIHAELMPPEVLDGRHTAIVRRAVCFALTGVLALCALSYFVTVSNGNGASDALKAENARTQRLQAQQRSYSAVTQVKSAIAVASGQLATLMASDVDFAKLITAVETAAPAGTKFAQLTFTVDKAATGSTQSSSATVGASALDSGTSAHIGTLAVNGTVPAFTDVAKYLDAVSKLTGVVQAYPGPATVGKDGVQFSIVLTVTDALLTHHFDASKNGK